MLDVYEVRAANLLSLLDIFEEKATLARAIGMAPTQLGQLIGPNRGRNMGERLARKIERRLKLKDGFLDRPQSK